MLMGLQWVEEAKSKEEVGPVTEWGPLWEVEEFSCGRYGIGFIP